MEKARKSKEEIKEILRKYYNDDIYEDEAVKEICGDDEPDSSVQNSTLPTGDPKPGSTTP